MPRSKRILFPDACYHVFNRGISKKTIVFSETHKLFFLHLLDSMTLQFDVKIMAYCLMTNHYHILVQTPKANLNKAMHYFGSHFARQINRDLNADGSLFRDRYKSLLVDTDSYLLQVSRYIHLNPVEANLVSKPEDYTWSSYASYLNQELATSDTFLKKMPILSYFKDDNDYQYFVNQGIDKVTQEFYSSKKKKSIIGTKEFIKKFR